MKLIAIVDDQPTNRAIFGQLARRISRHIEVETFASPQEALTAFSNARHPDLLITDFKMPGMDGAAFVRVLREKSWGFDVPVIVVTAYEDREFRLAALEAGATDFLNSPVDHTEFVTRAQNLIQLASYRKQARSRTVTLERELADSHRAREALLRKSRQHLFEVIDTVPAMIGATDESGRYVFVNRQLAETFGSTPEALTGQLTHDSDLSSRRIATLEPGDTTVTGAIERYEELVRDAGGRERVFLTSRTPLSNGDKDTPLILTTSLEITDLKQAEQKLHFLAYHDQLTQAPNRLRVEKEIQTLLASDGNETTPFALFLLDIDRFKAINDTLGHSTGDRLLKSVASRLAEVLPGAEIIGRLGGDEFGVVHKLDGTHCEEDTRRIATVIREAFSRPFSIGGVLGSKLDDSVVISTCSIGIAVHDGGVESFDTILKRADMALYRAKAIGGDSFQLFQPDMEKAEAVAMRIELDLHEAVSSEHLVLYYQPQVDLRSGRITGVEALLRWQKPDGSLIAPGDFLPVAEETGLIVPITDLVLKTACRQLVAWNRDGIRPRMAVNLSGVLFRRLDIRSLILPCVTESGINPNDLELELTESVLIGNAETANRQLVDLRDLGVSVAVDDFGTGYASLGYLRRLAIDRVKIDKSFIARIEETACDQTIVRSILDLCRNLGIKVTVEGIERPGQAIWLARHKCESGQGYYFGRPQAASEMEKMLRASPLALPDAGDDLLRGISSAAAQGSEWAT